MPYKNTLTLCWQLHFTKFHPMLCHKTLYLTQEVNCTEPSSVFPGLGFCGKGELRDLKQVPRLLSMMLAIVLGLFPRKWPKIGLLYTSLSLAVQQTDLVSAEQLEWTTLYPD